MQDYSNQSLSSATEALLGQTYQGAIAKIAKKHLRACSLSLAVLAATTANQNAIAQSDKEWLFNTSFLYYQETDRIYAIEPSIYATRKYSEETALTLFFSYDTLGGSSPNGAISTDRVDTFSTPSGGGTYEVAANEKPVDDTFEDVRIATSVSYATEISNQLLGSIGLGLSNEYDYTSISINGGLTRRLNKNNTEISTNFSIAYDTVYPVGGIPTAGDCQNRTDTNFNCTAIDTPDNRAQDKTDKQVLDLVLNFTQNLSQFTVWQSALSFSSSDGYQNDPYKIISVVDSNGDAGTGIGYIERNIFESRPNLRNKSALFNRIKSWIRGNIVDLSYRYLTDDWGLESHTYQLNLQLPINDIYTIAPRLRLYQQTAIDYYTPYIVDYSADLLDYYTSDLRQGNYDATTIGVEFKMRMPNNQTLRLSLENYNQKVYGARSTLGQLANQDLGEDLHAVIFRVYYDF